MRVHTNLKLCLRIICAILAYLKSYQDFKMPWPKTPPFRVVPTARFSVFAPAYPIAKDGAIELNEDFYSTIGPEPVRDLGVGDSALLLDLFDDSDGAPQLFEEVSSSQAWRNMDI